MKTVLVSVPIANTRIPPLSIALLAGWLKENGHQVRCFDFNIAAFASVEPRLQDYWRFYMGHHWNDTSSFTRIIYPEIIARFIDQWVDLILAEKPGVVGISMNTQPVARALAEKLKAIQPELKIVLGGPTCSVVYSKISARPSEFEDAVVSGEGEETLLELINQLEESGEFKPTAGATIFNKGNYIYGGERPPIKELDKLAFADFSDFDLSLYRDIDVDVTASIPIYSSRGCVGNCAFCMDNRMWGNCWRPREPKNVVAEMIYQSDKYGITEFTFTDLVINGSIKRLDEFADLLVKSGRSFHFWAPARIDHRLTLELLIKLKSIGLNHLNFGLESGSNSVLKKMKKGYDAQTASSVLHKVHEAGMTVSINLITGFPGETWWDYVKTIWFVYCHRKLIWNRPGVTECAVIPGSDLADFPEKYGVVLNYQDHFSHYSWVSNDGRNTPRLREWKKKIINAVMTRINFQEDLTK